MANEARKLTRREVLARSYSVAVTSLLAGAAASGCGGSDPPAAEASKLLCDNTCTTHGNSRCEDGGTGSTASTCNTGTDCSDCGVRYGPEGYSNQYSNGYSNYSNAYSNTYSNTYSNYSNTYSNTYSNYSNYYSNYSNYYSNYYNTGYYNYYNTPSYYNYFVNSW